MIQESVIITTVVVVCILAVIGCFMLVFKLGFNLGRDAEMRNYKFLMNKHPNQISPNHVALVTASENAKEAHRMALEAHKIAKETTDKAIAAYQKNKS